MKENMKEDIKLTIKNLIYKLLPTPHEFSYSFEIEPLIYMIYKEIINDIVRAKSGRIEFFIRKLYEERKVIKNGKTKKRKAG